MIFTLLIFRERNKRTLAFFLNIEIKQFEKEKPVFLSQEYFIGTENDISERSYFICHVADSCDCAIGRRGDWRLLGKSQRLYKPKLRHRSWFSFL